ncbi:MAG: type II toxin-antitoxin system RelE/ParE family toxin [Sphingomonadaceae bacterium]
MIESFRHKGLALLFINNDASKVRADLVERCRNRLAALDEANVPEDMNVPGFDFHKLQGKPLRYAVKVNGPWRITFEFGDGNARKVDLENYH